jgi:2-C-methyl-D-erythritol 4-phosphate cytidylyltransferase
MTARYFGLVPAAGSSSRFGADALKQYAPLAGKSMLHHALERLLGAPEVEIAFVVLAPGDADFRKHDWSAFRGRRGARAC